MSPTSTWLRYLYLLAILHWLGLVDSQYALVQETLETESIMRSKTILLAAGINYAAASSLLPFTFEPLPLGSIQPVGWLKDQLNLMAGGLAGQQYNFYLYVKNSSWLGGNQEYSDLNEGFPYWLNGLVPLAYSTNNPTLKAQVHSSVSYVLAHQSDDGWLGPENMTSRNFWARYPLCLGLTQLVEANSTWETPVLNALYKFVNLMSDMLNNNNTGYTYHAGDDLKPSEYSWTLIRSPDMMLTLQWLYDYHPGDYSTLLLQVMQQLYDSSLKWEAWYNDVTYIKDDLWSVPGAPENGDTDYSYVHGVNVGQGFKAPAVIHRFTQNSSLLETAMNGVNWTFTYHGAASGTILADEREGGLSPYSGSELCTAVETMYSLSYLYQALGTKYYADQAELAAYNALPVMMTSRWWAHQYVAQPNQPFATTLNTSPFYNVQTWGQSFGLEPDFPCCTVNHPQGYPKFLSASFVRAGSNGIAHALLSPAQVSTTISSGNVYIKCVTNYPFGNTLTYTISSTQAFDFYVRVPYWNYAPGSSIKVGSGSAQALQPDGTTGLHHLSLPAGSSTVSYVVGNALRVVPRANDTVAIYSGALLYALAVNYTSTSTLPHPYNNRSTLFQNYAPSSSRDWNYYNSSAWNIAIDPSTIGMVSSVDINTVKLANPIFNTGAPPLHMEVKACQIAWPLFLSSTPGPAPPLASRQCLGSTFTARLVPYGSAKLHMAELPTINLA